jgi:hypothetical protein
MPSYYNIEVLKDDQIIASKKLNSLPGVRAVWPIVIELAASHMKGCQIRVLNGRGEIELLTGVAAARRFVGTKVAAFSGALLTLGDPLDLLLVQSLA